MTREEKLTELYRLMTRRYKIILVGLIGCLVMLVIQITIILLRLLPMEVMLFYPLFPFVWITVFVSLNEFYSLRVTKLWNEVYP